MTESAQPNALSVGAQLQAARCQQQRSLADVTRATKIQPWVLEALEADRLHELMSPIYVKGFVTSYARWLHLDPAPLLAQLPCARQAAEDNAPQASLPPPAATPSLRSVFTGWSWPSWSWPSVRRVGVAVAMSALVIGVAVQPFRKMPTKHAAKRGASPALASVAKVAEPSAPLALPTLTLLATQPLELGVAAQQPLWIQVRADGKLLTQQRLSRGAAERWTAKKQFELVVSKPSQVELTLNGHSISPFAIAHRGRLLITHRGITQLPDEE